MTINRNVGGVWRPSVDVWRNVGGTWKRAQQVWRNVGGTWRLEHQISLAPSFALSVAPSAGGTYAYDSSGAAGQATFSFDAAMSGGTAPYAGSWSRIAQSGSALDSTGTTGTHLAVKATWVRHGVATFSETWRFTGNDSASGSAFYDVSLYLEVRNGTS